MDEIRHVSLVLLRQLRQIDRRCNEKCLQRPHPFTSFRTRLADVALAQQLIQPLQVLDVSSQVVQKHNVKENSHHLRERRVFIIRGFFLMFEIFAANTNREDLCRTQANNRAQRLLQADTTVTEKCRSSRCSKPYRLKDQRNGRRSANMVDGYFCRQGHPPSSVPHRMALRSLDEEI